jgi:hypothetical protein
MSLDKAILHGKEHRKHYRWAKASDRSCRNHGRVLGAEGTVFKNKRRLLKNTDMRNN